MTSGGHLCALYASELGRATIAVRFVLEGLQEGSMVYVVTSARSTVSEHQPTPAEQVRFFQTAMKKAEDEGVESFRVVGDMWGLRRLVSPKEMIELELGFERIIIPCFPVVALCAYDARKFTGVELLDALKAHDDTFRYPLGRTIA